MKAVVAAFNQENALVGAFSVLTNLRMELFQALSSSPPSASAETPHKDAVDSVARRAAPSSPSAESASPVTKAVCASGQGKVDELSEVSSSSPSSSEVDEAYCVEAERGKVHK